MQKNHSKIIAKGAKKIVAYIAIAGIVITSFPAISVDAATSSTTLEQQIAAAEQELEDAKTNQSEAAQKYTQGYLGFIDWMLEQDNLTTTQKYDLNQARTVITKAQEEDFSKWSGGDSTGLPDERNNMVCVIGDLYDATSIANIKNSITIMKSINYLRENDDNYVDTMKRNASYTNFYFGAVAQTGADRGAGLKNHSLLQVSCENLAFGASSPAYAWYNEKSIFNTIKTSLGIISLTSEADVSDIEKEAASQGKTIGHYTNLFYAADQIMGAGYTDYSRTSCYNASKLSNYSSKYAYYTIDEFEALFNQYYATIDSDIWQEKVDDAQEKLDNLLEQRYAACSEHTYGDVSHVDATCTDEGYDAYVCSKCGYTKKENVVVALGHSLTDGVCDRCGITTVKKVNSVTLSYTSGLSTYSNSTYNQTYEVGQELSLKISFTSASKYSADDVFVIDIKDPSIIGYEASSNSTGTMTMLSIGETTFDVYPKDNPSLIKTYTINVTDVGGHDFTIAEAKEGETETTETCSKCGQTNTITVPTSITNTVWYKGSLGTYQPVQYDVGDEVTLRIYYSPTSVDNSEFTVEISDTSVAEYTGTNNYTGTITMLKPGDVAVTIYATYNPAVKVSYEITVQHTLNETITKEATCTAEGEKKVTCTGCGYSGTEIIPVIQHEAKEGSEATCTDISICKNCGQSYGTVDADNHKWNSGEITKTATCTSTGEITYTCIYNDAHTKIEEIPVDATGHAYTNYVTNNDAMVATCTATGQTASKTAACDNGCDTTDTIKGEVIAKLVHNYKMATTKATTSKAGSIIQSCSVCGAVKSKTTIAYAKTATLLAAAYTYTGKALKPSVTVTDSNGKKISSSNYTVTYINNSKVGKATVKITLKGNYRGTFTKTFKINPRATTLSKLTATSKGFKVTWKKQASQTTGYEIRYSTKASMRGAKTVTVKKNSTISTTVKKLVAKKKYYVQICTYTTVNGTKYYSSWSKVKTVTTKK
jgi:Rps23 Pro-64 3,4-dihydroxylase Tpa1-like proline 4-hydroxylase